MSIKRQTLWNLAPLLLAAAVAFFSMPMFLSFLGTERYAIFLYVTSISTMFGFSDLGLGVVVGRNISMALGKKDTAAVRRYWGTGNLIVLPVLTLATLIFIGAAVWLGPKWFDKLTPDNIPLFRACMAANGVGLFFAYYGSYWLTISQAYLDFKFIGLIRSVMTPLQIIPSVALAYFTRDPLWVLLWSAVVSLVQLILLIWHARRHYSLGMCLGAADRACAREMAGYTAKMVLSLVVGSFFSSSIPNLLGKLASAAAFVPFGLSNKISSQLQSLSVAVMGPVLHNTARGAENRGTAAEIYNHMFAFMFEWYLFATIWLGLWHAVLLRLWLTHTMEVQHGKVIALEVGPLLIPLVAACCFSSLANIASAQLTSLNRLGTTVVFAVIAGLLAIDAVLIGWCMAGMVGAVYGYLFSRVAMVAQDLYAIRLINARGWLDIRNWQNAAGQCLLAALFSLAYLFLNGDSYWLLAPAAAHGLLTALWLLRQPLLRMLNFPKFVRTAHS